MDFVFSSRGGGTLTCKKKNYNLFLNKRDFQNLLGPLLLFPLLSFTHAQGTFFYFFCSNIKRLELCVWVGMWVNSPQVFKIRKWYISQGMMDRPGSSRSGHFELNSGYGQASWPFVELHGRTSVYQTICRTPAGKLGPGPKFFFRVSSSVFSGRNNFIKIKPQKHINKIVRLTSPEAVKKLFPELQALSGAVQSRFSLFW